MKDEIHELIELVSFKLSCKNEIDRLKMELEESHNVIKALKEKVENLEKSMHEQQKLHDQQTLEHIVNIYTIKNKCKELLLVSKLL